MVDATTARVAWSMVRRTGCAVRVIRQARQWNGLTSALPAKWKQVNGYISLNVVESHGERFLCWTSKRPLTAYVAGRIAWWRFFITIRIIRAASQA